MKSPLSPVLHVASGKWMIGKIKDHNAVPLSRDEIDDHIAEHTALREERDRLLRWKEEQMTVRQWWDKIDTYIRDHIEDDLGKSVTDVALKRLQERDKLKTELGAAGELLEASRWNADDLCKQRNEFRDERDQLKAELAEARDTLQAFQDALTKCGYKLETDEHGVVYESPTDFILEAFTTRDQLRAKVAELKRELKETESANKTLHNLMVSGEKRGHDKANEHFKATIAELEKDKARLDEVLRQCAVVNATVKQGNFYLPETRGGVDTAVQPEVKR